MISDEFCQIIGKYNRNVFIDSKKPIDDNLEKSGGAMRQENVQYFTEKEEEFANLLIEIGTKKNIAKMLVFLAGTPEATSPAIERGTDMRQPEISMAMKYLTNQGWIKSRESPSEHKGRPMKVYELAKPITEIMDCIEIEKKKEANNQLALIKKLRNYLR
jgi:predicted transcriptional regulator